MSAKPTHRIVTAYVKLRLPRDGAPNIPMSRVSEMIDGELAIAKKTLLERVEQIRDFSKRIVQ